MDKKPSKEKPTLKPKTSRVVKDKFPYEDGIRQMFVDCFSAVESKNLLRALDFTTQKHEGQMRKNGIDPYVKHPIEVARILLKINAPYPLVAAALLHDVLEDTETSKEEMSKNFDAEVTKLVDGVTKLKKYKFKSIEEEEAENFRKFYLAMADDTDVVVIKLADRLHNMQTISGLTPLKQIAYAQETRDLYAPLASRLGMSYIKCELEDIVLRTLEPEFYKDLKTKIKQRKEERQEIIAKIIERLQTVLDHYEIKGIVNGRAKHFASIHRKMTVRKMSFDQIFDLTAVRVIVENLNDCYAALGAIHDKSISGFTPLPGKFKDYIAVPKINGYQSLHTTIMTPFGIPCEVQIRSNEMHQVAEFGVAAHWMYKENRKKKTKLDEQIGELRKAMEEDSGSTSEELFTSIKADLGASEIFVFTPKGKSISLPEDSTPVDFAYRVHSEVGEKCAGCKVNNRIVPLDSTLKTGDYVEILTSNNSKGPSRDWLRFVKSSNAKARIKAFFKKELKTENIERGKSKLEEEAREKGYTLSQLLEPKWVDIVMKRYALSSIDDMFATVGYGAFSVNQILGKLIGFHKKENPQQKTFKNFESKDERKRHGLLVDGHDDLAVTMAKCCSPVKGDKVTGYISFGRGISVHRETCSNIKGFDPKRLIDVLWSEVKSEPFEVKLQIEAKNTDGLLNKITMLIYELKLSISSFNASIDKRGMGIIKIGVRITEHNQVQSLIGKIEKIQEVEKVFRP